MKLHLVSKAAGSGRRTVSRRATLVATALGMAALLATTPAVAQNPFFGGFAGPVQAGTGLEQAVAEPVAEPSMRAPSQISAPAPAKEEVNLFRPQRAPFLVLEAEQETGQSSSQGVPVATDPPKSTATKTKPPHHALGMTLAVVGTTALVAGVVLLAGEHSISVCNGASNGCNEARDAGLALIPVGAGVAVTGFYLQFHH